MDRQRGRYSQEEAKKELNRRGLWSYVEPILTLGSAAFAEPVAGLAGIAALPYGVEAASRAIENTQDALTYQPRTKGATETLQAAGEFLQPVGDAFVGASEYLGDTAYDVTGSPALAAAAYSLPTLALEAIGLRGASKISKGQAYEVGDIGGQASSIGGKQRGVVGGIGKQEAIAELETRGVLPMDTASRMQRAKEQGFDTDNQVFHGSTHDISKFGGNYEKGGHFGGTNYFTSSADDASRNYAGEGPDLTNRIDSMAERLESEMDIDFDEARMIAAKRLKGANEGVVYPTMLKRGKQFNIDDGDTFLKYERDVGDWEDYLDDAGGDEDYARELAEEASWDSEPEGELADFIQSISDQADDLGFDSSELIGRIQESAYDGGISASELDDIMRTTEFYAEDYDTGDLINNEVYRKAIEDSGFDSIKHKGDIFQGMDIEGGTSHTMVFDPSNIRSVNAAFDPAKKDSSNLLAGVGAGALGLGYLNQEDESY